MCCKPIRTKSDRCEDEVENVLKTYREVIDNMGKVSLSHRNRLSRENRDFQDGKIKFFLEKGKFPLRGEIKHSTFKRLTG